MSGRTRTFTVYRNGYVRSVTTTFISHQDDTQQKHDQVVSVAEFNPDGSLIRMTNLTYPYDYAEPVIADFWSDPNGDALVHLMDGLEMGGKWNFIYSNEWPAKYTEVIEDRGHPRYKGLNDANYGRFNYKSCKIWNTWNAKGPRSSFRIVMLNASIFTKVIACNAVNSP